MWDMLTKSRFSVLVLAVCAVMLSTPVVFTGDPDAPSWRGESSSTYHEWHFSTNSNPAVPEDYGNPFGEPNAAIDYVPPWGSGWYDTLPKVYGPNAQGWWDISAGSIALDIASSPDTGASTSKEIQVKVVYWKDINLAPTVVITPTASLISKTTALVESGPVGGGWYKDIWNFITDPAVDQEDITVRGHSSMGSQIDKVVVDTRYTAVLNTVSETRTLPVETPCEISGPVVTRAFDTFYYVEDLSRASGIRVNCKEGEVPPAEGSIPTIKGILGVMPGGERVIDQASSQPGGSGSVRPLAMICRAVRTGLSPQGLLIGLCGRAQVFSGSSTFAISDGSRAGVAVELHGVEPPPDGAYVLVTGVLGANLDGPVLHVKDSVIVR